MRNSHLCEKIHRERQKDRERERERERQRDTHIYIHTHKRRTVCDGVPSTAKIGYCSHGGGLNH